MKKLLLKAMALCLIVSLVSCASSKKAPTKEEPLSVTTQDNKKDTLPSADVSADELSDSIMDTDLSKISEPGMVVTEGTEGLSDSLTTHDKTQTNVQIHEIKDANYIESSDAADLAAQRAAAQAEADQWKQNHKEILTKSINNVTQNDIAAIQKAIDDYNKLSPAAKNLLTSEYKDLQNKLAKANADAKADADIAKWKQTHNAIISKDANSITANDLNAIQKAISDYNNLSDVAKAKLVKEYKDLQNKLAKAKAAADKAKSDADAKAKADAAAKAKAEADAKAKAEAAAKAKAQSAADKWKKDNSVIINKNINSITANDLNAIQKAINEYNALSNEAKALVQKEYKDLQNKLALAKAAAENASKDKDAGNKISSDLTSGNGKETSNLANGHVILDNAQYYTVRRGDMLILIARRFYGSERENYFPVIIAGTEEKIDDPDLIEPGQKLTIPDIKAALSTEDSKEYVRKTFYEVADKYDQKGKPGMASQLRAIAASL